MNAIVEHTPDHPSVLFALSLARDAIELQDFVVAAAIYTDLLEQALDPDIRSDVEANLAVALHMLASAKPGTPGALRQLKQALKLLHDALRYQREHNDPRKVAQARANLALVHLALHEATGDEREMLAAHLVLDGTQAMLAEANDAALNVWVASIHTHLLRLRDQRSKRRHAIF